MKLDRMLECTFNWNSGARRYVNVSRAAFEGDGQHSWSQQFRLKAGGSLGCEPATLPRRQGTYDQTYRDCRSQVPYERQDLARLLSGMSLFETLTHEQVCGRCPPRFTLQLEAHVILQEMGASFLVTLKKCEVRPSISS